YERGYEFATNGLAIACPNDGLPIEDWIYQYGLLDELSVCAYWTERYTECVSACDRLLTEAQIPTDMRDRVVKNRNFAIGKQQESIAASSPDSSEYIRLLRAAREMERLSACSDETIAAYMKAAAACPTRAEALLWTERYQECLDACQRLMRERQMPKDMYDRV